jgi:hypothetical protein
VSTAIEAPPAPKKKRGRESALDMVRSLGLCLLVVIPIWYLAQPPDEAEQRLRVVDQRPVVEAWRDAVEGAPAPQPPPADWQPTVGTNVPQPAGVRLGWNTPSGGYTEFAASTGARQAFLEDATGGQADGRSVEVDGTAWQRWVDEDDGSVSLVRVEGDVTVVVGTRRSSVPEDELLELARHVQP